MNTKQKITNDRVTICVFRGRSIYKKEIKKRLEDIALRTGQKPSLESLLEYGLNLALAELGERPIAKPFSRLQGRYNKEI